MLSNAMTVALQRVTKILLDTVFAATVTLSTHIATLLDALALFLRAPGAGGLKRCKQEYEEEEKKAKEAHGVLLFRILCFKLGSMM